MQIKKTDGNMVPLEEVLAYRTEQVAKRGRTHPWYAWGDTNAVVQHLGLDYNDFHKKRSSDEYEEKAKAWAKKNKVDYKHVKRAAPRSNSVLKKSDYESIGHMVIDNLLSRVESAEGIGDHITTKEWADENVLNLLDQAEFIPSNRPLREVKTRRKSVVVAERERAIEELRKAGVDEEIIQQTYPPF